MPIIPESHSDELRHSREIALLSGINPRFDTESVATQGRTTVARNPHSKTPVYSFHLTFDLTPGVSPAKARIHTFK